MARNRELLTVVLCFSICASGEHSANSSQDAAEAAAHFESSRALRDDFMDNKWKAVETIPLDTRGWIPEPNPQAEALTQDEDVPRRRRIRKRKRRPPVLSLTENEEPERILSGRRRRPHLEEHLPWNEMVQEARITPNKRRRVIPTYQPTYSGEKDVQTEKAVQIEKGVQTQKGGFAMEEEVSSLKMLLKQAGSLSEILQKRNLTLSDLLKGERKAISALTDRTNDVESVTEHRNHPTAEEKVEIITRPPDIVHEIKVKTAFINDNNNNMKYDVNHSSESTERTTKLGNIIVIDYIPNINQFGNGFSRESTTVPDVPTRKPGTKKSHTVGLPVTNAKLMKFFVPRTASTKNEIPQTPEPPKPYRIPVSEILNMAKEFNKDNKKNDEPLRMSIDLNRVFEEKHKTQESSVEATKTTELLKTSDSTKIPEPIKTTIPPKIKAITAKDEIFEILKDIRTKDNLTKILKNRNMTIDDLVELRERGSSQKHLADLFHNKTREPEPVEKVYVGQFVNPHPTERVPKSKRPAEIEAVSTRKPTEISVEETSERLEENMEKNKYTITSFPTYKIEMDKKYKEVISEPIWKDYDKLYHSTHQKGTVENLDDFEDLQTVDDEITSNSISEKKSENLNVDIQDKFHDEDGNVFIKLPYGVKHAILASLLIIGVSLFIFVTILVIFKWSQKHKRKLCYRGSFSCSKFNSILEDGEKRTFKTFVSETLGRKKHFYKQHLQSMSDTWENDKKPFQ